MRQPLVSVIVPTKNSAQFLPACLQSIANQTYPRIELIVVDNNSTDTTKDIAAKFTQHVFNQGPERSAQRNFAVTQAKGEYVAIIDSDMELTAKVIEDCVNVALSEGKIGGVIIPEESFGEGFWAQCKRLERSFYVGLNWIEAARFFPTSVYRQTGGYDESLVSGEDWDLSHRASKLGPILRVPSFIRHNEGHLELWRTLKKKFYYAGQAKAYLAKNPVGSKLSAQVGPIQRYKLFFSKPGKLFRRPLQGLGMLFMKTAEFAFGAAGYVLSKQHHVSP